MIEGACSQAPRIELVPARNERRADEFFSDLYMCVTANSHGYLCMNIQTYTETLNKSKTFLKVKI